MPPHCKPAQPEGMGRGRRATGMNRSRARCVRVLSPPGFSNPDNAAARMSRDDRSVLESPDAARVGETGKSPRFAKRPVITRMARKATFLRWSSPPSAFSFQIATDTQEETDRHWNAIVSNAGEECHCGWCKERWGISCQITTRVPTDPSVTGDAEAKRDDARSASFRSPTSRLR